MCKVVKGSPILENWSFSDHFWAISSLGHSHQRGVQPEAKGERKRFFFISCVGFNADEAHHTCRDRTVCALPLLDIVTDDEGI